jgi:hypothetical protein
MTGSCIWCLPTKMGALRDCPVRRLRHLPLREKDQLLRLLSVSLTGRPGTQKRILTAAVNPVAG